MPTKTKKVPAKSAKKTNSKKTAKKTKKVALQENIVVEQSQGVYTLEIAPSTEATNNQITDSVSTQPAPTETASIQTPAIEYTPEASPDIYNNKVNNNEVIAENVSYNNMVVPEHTDKTYVYIICGFISIVILTMIFL